MIFICNPADFSIQPHPEFSFPGRPKRSIGTRSIFTIMTEKIQMIFHHKKIKPYLSTLPVPETDHAESRIFKQLRIADEIR